VLNIYLINRKNQRNLKIFFSIFFVAFCLFVNTGFALPKINEDISYLAPGKFEELLYKNNYITIVVELPEIHKPDAWRSLYANADKNGKSLHEVAEAFGGFVYINNPEYSYSKIILPSKNYTSLTKKLLSFGFSIRNNTFLSIALSDSKLIIGAPSVVKRSSTSETFYLRGTGRKIAILDTGIYASHPDFQGKNIIWSDEVNFRSTPYDDNGHGTHVASIAAGSSLGNNYFGIAPGADLLITKVCDYRGGCELAKIADALWSLTNFNPDVVSMSLILQEGREIPIDWCNCNTPNHDVQDVCDAISQLINNNDVMVVASAGNEGPFAHISFPACINEVIAVGSSQKSSGRLDDYQYVDSFPISEPKQIGRIHALIYINGNLVLDKVWNGTYVKDQFQEWVISGFRKWFIPSSWPAKVEVKVEAEHKQRDCYQEERTWWDPGSPIQYDKYWYWNETFNYDSSKPVVIVEIGAWPEGAEGGPFSCFELNDWWKIYYNDYTCSGTAFNCDFFDVAEYGCKLQTGCSWCGCYEYQVGGVWLCNPSRPKSECTGSLRNWLGCEGTVKPCSDRKQENGDLCEGATGCTASWNKNKNVAVNIYRVNSVEGIPSLFSSRGPAVQNQNLIKPLVLAPGENICAAKAPSNIGGSSICYDDNHVAMSGTSMAAPMVAGEIALLRELASRTGRTTTQDIESAVKQTDEKVFSGNPDFLEGYGRINMRKAGKNLCSDCQIDFIGYGGGTPGGGSPFRNTIC
jgi:subtilisin family serine protease